MYQIVCLATLISLQALPGAKPELQPTVVIDLHKETYLSVEPVWVRIVAKNETSVSLRIGSIGPMDRLLGFTLLSPEGEEIRYSGNRAGPFSKTPSHFLAPGDSVVEEFNLLEAYAWPRVKRPRGEARVMNYLHPGCTRSQRTSTG
jgi:hypothetical protein